MKTNVDLYSLKEHTLMKSFAGDPRTVTSDRIVYNNSSLSFLLFELVESSVRETTEISNIRNERKTSEFTQIYFNKMRAEI